MILAGGMATRLYPLTEDIPKSMIPICGKPFIHWQLELLKRNGYSEVILCVGHKSQIIKDCIGDGSKYGIKVKYSNDGETLLGTGGAILKACNLVTDSFAVLYGDSYLKLNFKEAEEKFCQSGNPAMMTVFRNVDEFDKSNLFYENNFVTDYSKKSPHIGFHHIDYGLSFFRKGIFLDYSPAIRFDLSEVCETLAKNGLLGGHEVYERFYEIGSIQGIRDLENYLGGNFNGIHQETPQ